VAAAAFLKMRALRLRALPGEVTSNNSAQINFFFFDFVFARTSSRAEHKARKPCSIGVRQTITAVNELSQ